MQTKTIYIAKDGKEFKDMKNCQTYEKQLEANLEDIKKYDYFKIEFAFDFGKDCFTKYNLVKVKKNTHRSFEPVYPKDLLKQLLGDDIAFSAEHDCFYYTRYIRDIEVEKVISEGNWQSYMDISKEVYGQIFLDPYNKEEVPMTTLQDILNGIWK